MFQIVFNFTMNRNDKRYQDLFQLYLKAHPGRLHSKCQGEVNNIWKTEIKVKKTCPLDVTKYNEACDKLKNKIKNSKPVGMEAFLSSNKNAGGNKNPNKTDIDNNVVVGRTETGEVEEVSFIEPVIVDEVADDALDEEQKEVVTPVQDRLRKEIDDKEKLLANLYEARNLDVCGGSVVTLSRRIKTVTEERDKIKKELKIRKQKTAASHRFRTKKKEFEEKVKRDYPDLAANLKLRETVGRPRLEVDQPGILEDLLRIATIGSACADKRRDDLFRSVKTTDDLHKAITDLGYKVSRSGLYLRLLPRDQTTQEGKRHVKTIPVKLVRPDNNLRKQHPDRMFAAESSRTVDSIASFLGPQACVYISQDDKSSVHIGVTAAKKQQSMLMNMRVRVRLPDHDFNVGSRHLLVPSVMANCVIDLKSGVTYTGPTYVAIRSSKHNNSSAYSHHDDLKRFIELNPSLFMEEGSDLQIKPVVIKAVDGGPDENPRFTNNTVMACKTFQVKLNLHPVAAIKPSFSGS